MLRRSFNFFYVHRTLTGVTIKDPVAIAKLDKMVEAHNIPRSPAAYWVTADMANRKFIRIPSSSTSLEVKVPLGQILTQQEKQECGKEVENVEKFLKNNEATVFPLAKTDSPRLRPVHAKQNFKFSPNEPIPFRDSTTQIILESVAAQRGFSSLLWISGKEVGFNRHLAVKSSADAGKPVPLPVGKTGDETHFFNMDVVVDKTSAEYLDSNNNNIEEQNEQQNQQESSFNNSSIDSMDQACGIHRFGSGQVLPQRISRELAKVKRHRGFKSNQWYSTKQMMEINLHPKNPDEKIITIITSQGTLFRCFNADQLDSGLNIHELVRLDSMTSLPIIATDEMERRAALSGIFLDATGKDFYKEEQREALKAAYARREDETASRQYFSQWHLSLLEMEPREGSEGVKFINPSGSTTVLYNRDDCQPMKSNKTRGPVMLNELPVQFDNEVDGAENYNSGAVGAGKKRKKKTTVHDVMGIEKKKNKSSKKISKKNKANVATDPLELGVYRGETKQQSKLEETENENDFVSNLLHSSSSSTSKRTSYAA